MKRLLFGLDLWFWLALFYFVAFVCGNDSTAVVVGFWACIILSELKPKGAKR